MSSKEIPYWIKVPAYGICAINSLVLLVFMVEWLFCEIDLFGLLWMLSAFVLLWSVPLGLIIFIYSLFHLRQRAGRCIALWNVLIVLVACVTFWLLPNGLSRVPAKMEQHCLKYESTMLAVANQLYDLMPDSTMLVYTQKGEVTLHSIDSLNNILGYPFVADTDTFDASAIPSLEGYRKAGGYVSSILNSQLINSLHCKKLTVYKPTGLATFDYLYSGWARYWFEVSLNPYTEEVRQRQLDTYNIIPFSSHVCFRFDGGATDHDGPFPYKEKYLESTSSEHSPERAK